MTRMVLFGLAFAMPALASAEFSGPTQGRGLSNATIGMVSVEANGVVHWWENQGDVTVKMIDIDIFQSTM